MPIEHNRPLKSLTTFKIGGRAREFLDLAIPAELPAAIHYASTHGLQILILGGGSNMLVSDRGFEGLVIHLANKGMELQDQTRLRVASGERWDDVVKFAAHEGLWGIENLSRIPGSTGAVAVQNVGAYGQEIKNVLVTVEVFDRRSNSFRTLSKEECQFTYRKSIFNTQEKGRYIILHTTLELSKIPHPNLSYPDVKIWFERNPAPSLAEIREAIQSIRDRKFPFPAESVEGNAGSFFKNSVLTDDQFRELERNFARNLPEYAEQLRRCAPESGASTSDFGPRVRVPSAFILEACGLKGFRRGDVQLNPSQPVIVLNVTGQATADEVLSVVREVRALVREKTGLHLSTEPELIGFTEAELRGYGFIDEEIQRYINK